MEIMIDLETMGTSSFSPIIAIGAVSFSESGIESKFYSQVSLKSSVDCGANIDPETVIWWLKQSLEARSKFFENDSANTLEDSLDEFSNWVSEKKPSGVWGCGAAFDNVIISNAFSMCGMKTPWPFCADKCYRTVRDMRPDIEFIRVGDHHNALDDAESQAIHLTKILWGEKL